MKPLVRRSRREQTNVYYIPDPGVTFFSLLVCLLYGACVFAWFIPRRRDGHTWDFMNDSFLMKLFLYILAIAICELLLVNGSLLLQDVIRKGCGSLCT